MQPEDLRFEAGDGHPIHATLFRPLRDRGLAVLVAGAIGARRSYYRHFAEALAYRGATVLSFDYRGIGGSVDPLLPPRSLQLADWGRLDLAAALEWMRIRLDYDGLGFVGHSVGGQMLGLAENNALLDAGVTVASQLGHWGYWPRATDRLKLRLASRIVMPTVNRFAGGIPGPLLGGVRLPSGIARDWAQWCGSRDYFLDAGGRPLPTCFESLRGPIRLYALSDDHFYAPPSAVQALQSRIGEARAELAIRRPEDWGRKHIGHFGFFRRGMEPAWREATDWLAQQIGIPLAPAGVETPGRPEPKLGATVHTLARA
ncbi:alpha/beta fold hydrolase [Niveibacterium sp. SC-1]|uniref:alpha/beta hydrolase family protein n=1 Tax=Niveibacterium sp. SC-1 TaxID=3135646 RepID=UPI0031201A6B